MRCIYKKDSVVAEEKFPKAPTKNFLKDMQTKYKKFNDAHPTAKSTLEINGFGADGGSIGVGSMVAGSAGGDACGGCGESLEENILSEAGKAASGGLATTKTKKLADWSSDFDALHEYYMDYKGIFDPKGTIKYADETIYNIYTSMQLFIYDYLIKNDKIKKESDKYVWINKTGFSSNDIFEIIKKTQVSQTLYYSNKNNCLNLKEFLILCYLKAKDFDDATISKTKKDSKVKGYNKFFGYDNAKRFSIFENWLKTSVFDGEFTKALSKISDKTSTFDEKSFKKDYNLYKDEDKEEYHLEDRKKVDSKSDIKSVGQWCVEDEILYIGLENKDGNLIIVNKSQYNPDNYENARDKAVEKQKKENAASNYLGLKSDSTMDLLQARADALVKDMEYSLTHAYLYYGDKNGPAVQRALYKDITGSKDNNDSLTVDKAVTMWYDKAWDNLKVDSQEVGKGAGNRFNIEAYYIAKVKGASGLSDIELYNKALTQDKSKNDDCQEVYYDTLKNILKKEFEPNRQLINKKILAPEDKDDKNPIVKNPPVSSGKATTRITKLDEVKAGTTIYSIYETNKDVFYYNWKVLSVSGNNIRLQLQEVYCNGYLAYNDTTKSRKAKEFIGKNYTVTFPYIASNKFYQGNYYIGRTDVGESIKSLDNLIVEAQDIPLSVAMSDIAQAVLKDKSISNFIEKGTEASKDAPTGSDSQADTKPIFTDNMLSILKPGKYFYSTQTEGDDVIHYEWEVSDINEKAQQIELLLKKVYINEKDASEMPELKSEMERNYNIPFKEFAGGKYYSGHYYPKVSDGAEAGLPESLSEEVHLSSGTNIYTFDEACEIISHFEDETRQTKALQILNSMVNELHPNRLEDVVIMITDEDKYNLYYSSDYISIKQFRDFIRYELAAENSTYMVTLHFDENDFMWLIFKNEQEYHDFIKDVN